MAETQRWDIRLLVTFILYIMCLLCEKGQKSTNGIYLLHQIQKYTNSGRIENLVCNC